MRKRDLGIAACLLLAAPAAAYQNASLAGTWSFQTVPFGDQSAGNVLTGTAIVSSLGGNQYSVRLVAMQLTWGQSTTSIYAYQSCRGTTSRGTVTIACQVTSTNGSAYRPDDFTIHRVSNDRWEGTFSSISTAAVTFLRVR